MNNRNSFTRDENIILKIRKKSDVSFWEYQILGLLSFFSNFGHDSLTITDKKITYIIKDQIIKSIQYKDFSTIKFYSLKDLITCVNINNEAETINLKKIRLSFEEIQDIKKILKQNI